MKYPVRCKIIDVTGMTKVIGSREYTLTTPEESKPHIGKEGLAEEDLTGLRVVRITLDDGNILFGYECWWTPIQ